MLPSTGYTQIEQVKEALDKFCAEPEDVSHYQVIDSRGRSCLVNGRNIGRNIRKGEISYPADRKLFQLWYQEGKLQ